MKKIVAERYLEAQKRMNYIFNFAKEMGYSVLKSEYEHCKNHRPCVSLELSGTWDSEGNPFAWAWYTDTWEEF